MKEKLVSLYEIALLNKKIFLPQDIKDKIFIISNNCLTQKGVYTVFLTLSIYKIHYPNQDIRYHQSSMKNGFSGRTIDTKFITPTLKELGLPSMQESGWLTRSLEQPYPYLLNYQGKISNKKLKIAFLELLDFLEHNFNYAEDIIIFLLQNVIKINKQQDISIDMIKENNINTIENIISQLKIFFNYKYSIKNSSKLPVLAFYAVFTILVKEIDRYKNCNLTKLDSHTASDKTTKKSADIEIFNTNKELFEAIEIKYNIEISYHILLIAEEKIKFYKPKRYYILSTKDIKEEDIVKINNKTIEIYKKYDCQVIINGLLPTIKYYLRLVNNINDFLNIYSVFISQDKELMPIHKQKWLETIKLFKNNNLR